jgi:hypothetical protein
LGEQEKEVVSRTRPTDLQGFSWMMESNGKSKVMVAGLRLRTAPYSFVMPQKSKQKKAPGSLPCGFPAFCFDFAAKKKTRAVSPQTVFFDIPAKTTLHSGGVTRESVVKSKNHF